MKTCRIREEIRELKNPADFQLFVRDCITRTVVTPAEGVMLISMYSLNYRSVYVDGKCLLEFAEME